MTTVAKNRAFKGRHTVLCVYCKKRLTRQQATGDHHRAISSGGFNKTKNIVMACFECNQRKGTMHPGTYMSLLREEVNK